MLLRENNQRRGDVAQCEAPPQLLDHPKVEYFPITAHSKVFYSSYATAIMLDYDGCCRVSARQISS